VSDPVLFFFAIAAILAAPGPTNTLLATSGATVGVVRSLGLLAAAIAGYLAAILAVHFIVGPIAESSPVTAITLKVAVALYLVWLAIKLWRQPLKLAEDAKAVSFANVLVATLLNPKALIFSLTIVPWSVSAIGWYLAAFAATIIAACGGWIVLGRILKHATGTRAGYIPRVASVVLVGFAGLMLRAVF
jgi:threonine/homoserine/homoserine lactone efflux protein